MTDYMNNFRGHKHIIGTSMNNRQANENRKKTRKETYNNGERRLNTIGQPVILNLFTCQAMYLTQIYNGFISVVARLACHSSFVITYSKTAMWLSGIHI